MLGVVGATAAGAAAAPALRVLTWPLLAFNVATLGRGWYLEVARRDSWRGAWAVRSRWILVGSTLLAAALWSARFAGLLGGRPF